MKYLNNFKKFFESGEQAPARPTIKPGVIPKPAKPGKIIRPSVDPAPKAEDVAKKFIELMNKKGEDVKKYL